MVCTRYLFLTAGALIALYGLYLLARTVMLLIVGVRTRAMIYNFPGSITHIEYTAGDKRIEKRFRRQLTPQEDEVLPEHRSVQLLYHPKKPGFYVIDSAWSLAGEPLTGLAVGGLTLYAALHII